MKKQISSESFKEAYTAFRVAAIIIFTLLTLFITIKACAFTFDCEFSIAERMCQERDHEERENEKCYERVQENEREGRESTERDIQRADRWDRDHGA